MTTETEPSVAEAAPSSASPTPVRVAVAGLGRAGITHAAVFANLAGGELLGLADRDATARRAAHGLGFSVPCFGDVRRLLERARPDALVVSTPQNQRVDVARQAIEAGCAVLIERPVSDRPGEAAALWALAGQRNVRLAATQPLALQPVFAWAARAQAAGVLGRLRQARSSMYRSLVFAPIPRERLDPRRVASGVLTHFSFDLLSLLVGMLGPPASVRAQGSAIYGTLEDELHAMMTLPDGVEVGFDSSWSQPGYPKASTVIELAGENGTLLVSNEACELELQSPVAGYPAGATRVRESELPQPARFDLDGEGFTLQNSAFLDWVAGGPAPVYAHANLAAHRVLDALLQSAREDGTSVAVGT